MKTFLDPTTLENLQVEIPEIIDDLEIQVCNQNLLKLSRFHCKRCKKLVETFSGFLFHLKTIHKFRVHECNEAAKLTKTYQTKTITGRSELKPTTCSECHNVYKTKRNLQRHFQRMHGRVDPYTCRYCNKWFQRKSDGIVHERKVHRNLVEQEKPFKCSLCIRGFDTKKFLDHHLTQHKVGELQCKFCCKEFFYSSLRATHEAACHSNSLDRTNDVTAFAPHRFECHYCGQTFSRKGSLVAHFTRHLILTEFICHICAQSFRRKDGLQRHVKNVHNGDEGIEIKLIKPIHATREIEKVITCQYCDLIFTSHRNLRMHKRKSHKESIQTIQEDSMASRLSADKNRIKCTQCSRTFVSLRFLQSHEQSHSKIYACCICQKILANASNLREHEKLHKTKMEFCEICGKSFHQKTGILRHQRDTHSITKKYKCNRCYRSFKHSTEYHIHKREHDDPDLKKCDICLKHFASRPSYFIHRRNAHPTLVK